MNELKLVWGESCIRNIKALAEELSVPTDDRRKRLEETVILAAFRKWGPEFGKHLYGRFSAVIEDISEKSCILSETISVLPLCITAYLTGYCVLRPAFAA